MADKKEVSEQKAELEDKISSYEKLIDKLQKERKHIENEIGDDYRNARRYVRSHPEEGILYAFLGGIALGVIIGKITK